MIAPGASPGPWHSQYEAAETLVRRRIDLMTDEGVTFVTGLNPSRPCGARRLIREFDAVVLCCGAEQPRDLGVDTAGVQGIVSMPWISFTPPLTGTSSGLSPISLMPRGKQVVVIGFTGNTASDCVAPASTPGLQGCAPACPAGPREDYLNPDGKLPRDYAQEELRLFSVQIRGCSGRVLQS